MAVLRHARKPGIRLLLLLALLVAVPLAGGTGTGPLAGRAQGASTGLVAAYSFDEGSGTTVADASGTGNAGSVSTTSWSSAGHFGGALSFNGTSSLVTIPDSASLDLTTGMTLEAWVKPSALGTAWRCVLFKERPGDMNYSLYANENTGVPDGQVYIGGEHDSRGSSSLPLDTWTFLAATYDGTTVRLYANGVQTGSVAVSGGIATPTGALHIDRDSVWGEWFQGLIDNVRVYNRALSVSELQTDMNAPVGSGSPPPPAPPPPPPPAPTGLVAAYAFDAGSGTTAADASGTGNTGSISGATWTGGRYGNALFFDGKSSWVTVPDAASLDLTSAVTLEAWVYPQDNV